jgi:hypothetical protein
MRIARPVVQVCSTGKSRICQIPTSLATLHPTPSVSVVAGRWIRRAYSREHVLPERREVLVRLQKRPHAAPRGPRLRDWLVQRRVR